MRVVVRGLDHLVKRLNNMESNFELKKREYLESLAEIGIDKAVTVFDAAEYSGTNDVTVQSGPEWIDDNTMAIVANGHAVAFIEFGAGTFYPDDHPKAAEVGAIRGAFGQKRGANPPWLYKGEAGKNSDATPAHDKSGAVRDGLWWTRGNPPAKAMYQAAELMREHAAEVAKEVFFGD